MTVYHLILKDNETEEEFDIGLFSSREKAENVARYYLSTVKGFCEYDCVYHIEEKAVLGGKNADTVYVACGWNGYEDDIVQSEFYTTEALAERKLVEMRVSYHCTEWTVSFYHIDECSWRDGFVRVNY